MSNNSEEGKHGLGNFQNLLSTMLGWKMYHRYKSPVQEHEGKSKGVFVPCC